mgnify:CR=1 FL=1
MQLTEKHKEYWSKNLRITAILLAIWFVSRIVMHDQHAAATDVSPK